MIQLYETPYLKLKQKATGILPTCVEAFKIIAMPSEIPKTFSLIEQEQEGVGQKVAKFWFPPGVSMAIYTLYS